MELAFYPGKADDYIRKADKLLILSFLILFDENQLTARPEGGLSELGGVIVCWG